MSNHIVHGALDRKLAALYGPPAGPVKWATCAGLRKAAPQAAWCLSAACVVYFFSAAACIAGVRKHLAACAARRC